MVWRAFENCASEAMQSVKNTTDRPKKNSDVHAGDSMYGFTTSAMLLHTPVRRTKSLPFQMKEGIVRIAFESEFTAVMHHMGVRESATSCSLGYPPDDLHKERIVPPGFVHARTSSWSTTRDDEERDDEEP
jgi:hypothetical protein